MINGQDDQPFRGILNIEAILKPPVTYDPEKNPMKYMVQYIMQATSQKYTQWSAFEGRKPFRLEYEQHICVY